MSARPLPKDHAPPATRPGPDARPGFVGRSVRGRPAPPGRSGTSSRTSWADPCGCRPLPVAVKLCLALACWRNEVA